MAEDKSAGEPCLESAWAIHSYVNEYIRFGDAKALVVIAWCSSLIAGLYSLNAHRLIVDLWEQFSWPAVLHALGAVLAFGLLVAGFTFSVLAIRPNLTTSRERGVIFWQTVRNFDTGTDYAQHLRGMGVIEFHEEVGRHIFDIAGIATRKYWWVNRSIWLAAAGSIVALCVAMALRSS